MSLNQNNPESMKDFDDFSVDTSITTPPETIPPYPASENDEALHKPSNPNLYTVPKAGSIYIICPVWSRDILTFLKGEVVLAPKGSFGSPYWECVKKDGWFGFRNIASYGYLGRNDQWRLCGDVKHHRGYERFQIQSTPEGGHIMVLEYWRKLLPVGLRQEKGEERLAMIDDERTGIVWKFEEVTSAFTAHV